LTHITFPLNSPPKRAGIHEIQSREKGEDDVGIRDSRRRRTIPFPGNDTGILVCHGFTGTPQSMFPLGRALHQAGYTVLGPRLPGHGTSLEDMARTDARDWIAGVEAALEKLQAKCRKIFMTGLSMGGTLTLYMAGQYPDAFAGIIPINAVVRLENPDLAGLAYMPGAPAVIPGIGSDIKKPGVTELAYSGVPVPCIAQIHALTAVTHALLPRIKTPALVITSREDHVVPPINGQLIAEALSARPEEISLEDSYHVATLDNDLPKIITESLRFIAAHQ
jgi:carboxylesterase